jgi:RNase H-fold protein (predicted Holliday junction resolvase)
MIGLSLGTRVIGLAIVKQGRLEFWGTKVFTGAWSARKLVHILNTLETYIKNYNIGCIFIKRPESPQTSEGLEELIDGVKALAKRLHVAFREYSLSDLKNYCNGAETKKEVISYILIHYPEVGKGIHFTTRNTPYHLKCIEAVAMVHIK